jgi:bifunctional DNA-binding transcriptional regulator/antitoxin component of YhaV-PrlF toxin-antitoxin module
MGTPSGSMIQSVVTVTGRVLIPSKLRRKLRIEGGIQGCRYDRDGEIVIRPIVDTYVREMAGMTRTNGRLLKGLLKAKARERES